MRNGILLTDFPHWKTLIFGLQNQSGLTQTQAQKDIQEVSRRVCLHGLPSHLATDCRNMF